MDDMVTVSSNAAGTEGSTLWLEAGEKIRMGDLLYTGTPAGVGPVRPGDNLRAVLEGRELLNFDIR